MASSDQPWKIVRVRHKKLHNVSTRRIIAAQVYTLVIAGLAGYLLSAGKDLFVLVGGALVLYPGITDLASSNATSLSVHIHHDLDTSPERSTTRIVFTNFAAAMLTTVVAGTIIGIIAGLVSNILFYSDVSDVIALSVSVATLIGLVAYPTIIAATLLLRKHNLNPDDIIAPIESSVIGAVSVAMIILMSGVIG